MPEVIHFNARNLRSLTPREGAAYYVHDDETRGLRCRVMPSGIKTLVLERRLKKKPRRWTLGRVDEIAVGAARNLCDEWNPLISRGIDPTEPDELDESPEAPPTTTTLRELFDIYIERHGRPRKKTWRFDVWAFDKYVGEFADKAVSEINGGDLAKLHAGIGEAHGHRTANVVHSLLRGVFNRAIKWELYDRVNPTRAVDRFREKSRDRYLTSDEVPRFLAAIEQEHHTIRDLFKTLLFTGARLGNTLAARWEDIDLDAAIWRIPSTKTGEALRLALVDDVADMLRYRRKILVKTGPWVFPLQSGKGQLRYTRRAWLRILERAEIDGLTIHDLRRTFGSWQAMGGAGLPIIGKSLGHRSPLSTAIYSRLQSEDARKSAQQAVTAMKKAAMPKKRPPSRG